MFGKGTRDIDILRQTRDRMRKELDAAWSHRKPDLPLQDADGQVRRDGSASEVPGLWFAGFPWLVQRRSSIFYGFPVDAAQTVHQITQHLVRTT